MKLFKFITLAAMFAGISMPAMAQMQIASGEFVAGDVGHGGGGTATIVEDNGSYRLELMDLVSDPGPDLKVVLVPVENAVTSPAIRNSEWVSLGALKSTTGDQTYDLPAGLDVSAYKTVAIWCEQYAVLFTAAPLTAQ